jgi:outer membrane protein OmpA-like peptidoglycan-associated protein
MVRLCVVAVLFVSTASFADAVNISVTSAAAMGKGQPSVNVHIQERIAGFRLTLKRSDGKEIDIKGGGKVGQTRVLDLNQPEGKFGYSGTLTVNFPNGSTSEMPLQFDAELWGPLHMKCEKSDIDFENRKVTFRLSRPAAKAVVQVLMDTGKYALNGEVLFDGAPAGSPLVVTWPEKPGKVMKVSIVAHDSGGFFTGVEFSPWQIDIAHKEVNFASGKWDVSPEEADKLEDSYVSITDVVNKYGQLAEVKLYVIGHTDTVGKNDANRSLSLNRARAIAGYLRKRGLRVPIFYEGYGEEALLVGTADEEAEPRNRRADYVMSINPPTLGKVPFEPKWQRL